MIAAGHFVISIDFELYWGVRDKRSLDDYAANLAGVHRAVPALLEMFERYDVHATWAVVGFLMLRDEADLIAHAPHALPCYTTDALDPYRYARQRRLRRDVHFAPALVERVLRARNQELATHTLSHFYALEAPRSLEAFRADLQAALSLTRERFNVTPTSLVFPRNQYAREHLIVACEEGVTAYRGNPEHWMYAPRSGDDESRVRRAARLIDAYIGLTNLTKGKAPQRADAPRNVPATRFLRPWSKRLAPFEPLRIARIQREMTCAARAGGNYHLWWHPHNFGTDLEQNMAGLERILRHFTDLRKRFDFRPMTMSGVAATSAGNS